MVEDDFWDAPLAFTFADGLKDDAATGFAGAKGFAAALGLGDFAGAALVTITTAGLAGAGTDFALAVLVVETLLEVTAKLAWKGAIPIAKLKNCQCNNLCAE